ncbi:MAG: CotH kinase family protein [Fibrobacteraceae bacterium]|nr:CotH kinase family protein [Fibrobacteraceae bacterium]
MLVKYLSFVCALLLGLISCTSEDGSGSGSLVEPVVDKVPSAVVFTEVDPVNLVYEDHEGGDKGWVELFNTSDTAVNLQGMYLTDSIENPTKWQFGKVVIPPQSFMLVFLSAKDIPDFEAPHDSIDLVGKGCWTWTDAQNDIPGESYVEKLPGQTRQCFVQNGQGMFAGKMQYGENEELGWSSISFFVGTESGNEASVVDISNTNEILLRGYISKDRLFMVRLAQSGVEEWKGWNKTLVGTGDSNTVYKIPLPTGSNFPDLENIYGTRFSPGDQEYQPVEFKAFSYVARNRGHEPHANFESHKSGGSLYMFNGAGALLDSVRYPAVPAGKSWSLGINSSGTESWGFAESSPYGYTTDKVLKSQVEIPQMELPPSGFYSAPIQIIFSEGSEIRCEKGGGAPTEKSAVATGTMNIDSTTVLRCASFAQDALPSSVISRTYIFESKPSVPAVFITGNPGSLFDADTGIYVEGPNAQSAEPHYGANYWMDKEIPVFVELFEPHSNSASFGENAGLAIFGNYSRANAKKSVAITFREKYGKKRLEYPLFPEFPELKKFKVFLLRNNGSNFRGDYIRDMLSGTLTSGMDLDYQRGRAAVVFYNGEYFGIHNIRERSTEYYFETHYDYDPDGIDLLKADNSASNGSSVDYVSLMDYLLSHSLENEENYNYVKSQIDVGNFINYVALESFVNNRDWPSNNLKKWRYNNPKTLWKWFVYDTDFGFGNEYSEYTNNFFEFAIDGGEEVWPNGEESTRLLRSLVKNEEFKNAFINRIALFLATNFSPERVLANINKLMGSIDGEIERDQKRWNLDVLYMSRQLEKIKDFALVRQVEISQELQEYFNLGMEVPLTLETLGAGKILVHGQPVAGTSVVVNFYKDTPVEVTAAPMGGVWAGWSDGVTEATRVVNPGEVSSLTAFFK